MKKTIQYGLKIALLVLALVFFPYVTLFYILCGLYDVSRNRNLDTSKVLQYFFGNGLFTWFLSPLNILLDILALPYLNKGIYKLEDLPPAYQQEIKHLIETAHQENLVEKLEERTRDLPRSMVFFKWYGANRENSLHIPEFVKKFRYLQTIGVSVFNRRESTSRHFGPLRATLRVLYNINHIDSDTVYIEVGAVKHYWRDEKLFIFDDTLLHQSFNESDKPRYCMFVDILRPSLVPGLLAFIVTIIRFLLSGYNAVFYKNWKVIKA